MTGKDQPFSAVEPAGQGRSGDDPELEKAGRASPIEHGESRGGAMTGETGSLTGVDDEDAFVPAELREINDPRHYGSLTAAGGALSEQHRERVDEEATDERGGAAPIPGAGERVTESSSGLGTLQGQATTLGGGGDARIRPEGGTGPTELSEREGGYGGDAGLARDDPAYRVEGDEVSEAAKRREER